MIGSVKTSASVDLGFCWAVVNYELISLLLYNAMFAVQWQRRYSEVAWWFNQEASAAEEFNGGSKSSNCLLSLPYMLYCNSIKFIPDYKSYYGGAGHNTVVKVRDFTLTGV